MKRLLKIVEIISIHWNLLGPDELLCTAGFCFSIYLIASVLTTK